MKRSMYEYPNNILADFGFGKIEGTFSEGFKSMLDDLLYSTDSREDKRNYEFLLSYYEQHNTLSAIARQYHSHTSTVGDSKDRMIKIFRNTPLNKQVHDILDDELKMNENVYVSKETSLNDISKFRYDSMGLRVYSVLKGNGFHTIGDVLQAGSAEIQSVLKHDGFAFAWLAELIISYCNQNPMDWKYHTNIHEETELLLC